MALFVVPCKFDRSQPLVFDCVSRIRTYHPGARVLVVDSDSEDRSYLDRMVDMGAEVADIGNRHYGIGAFRYAYRTNPAEEFFYLIYDSLMLMDNISWVMSAPLTTVRWFGATRHPNWGWYPDDQPLELWGDRMLAPLGIPRPTDYLGVAGPMWMTDWQVMDHLEEVGFWDMPMPTNKEELCGWERLAGVVFTHLGYDVKNAIQGEFITHDTTYDERYVAKLTVNRP